MGFMPTSILLHGENAFRKFHMVQIFGFIKLGKLSKTLGSSPRWFDESLPIFLLSSHLVKYRSVNIH